MKLTNAVTAVGMFLALGAPATLADESMGFFITSVGMGDGANLGGLEGADAHCAKLAEAAGTTGKTWRAYLSKTMLMVLSRQTGDRRLRVGIVVGCNKFPMFDTDFRPRLSNTPFGCISGSR